MTDFEKNGYELGWDGEIENDSPENVLLPEGEYNFVVERFERGRYEGGDKLPACNKATVFFKFSGPQGECVVRKDFFLHSKCEGILCAFFTCIGQRQHGQRIQMNWSAVPGASGRAKIGTRTYNGNTYNEIKRFIEPELSAQNQQPCQQPAYQVQHTATAKQQNQYQQQTFQGGYQPGKF